MWRHRGVRKEMMGTLFAFYFYLRIERALRAAIRPFHGYQQSGLWNVRCARHGDTDTPNPGRSSKVVNT